MLRSALCGARVFDGWRFLDDHAVVVEGTRIAAILPSSDVDQALEQHQLDGGVLAPGFVDLQVNGGGGLLFNDSPTASTVETIARTYRRTGTTSLLPTLISDRESVLRAGADAVAESLARGVPGVFGVHFEGPALGAERRGVHDEACLRPIDRALIDLFKRSDLGSVMVTLAPEQASVDDVAELAEAGVVVCLGHSAADYELATEFLEAGARGVTHLFNGMPPLMSRSPGLVGAALDAEKCYCGIIADGYHVHPAALRLAHKVAGRRLALVTDGMPCVGTEQDSFRLNDTTITVRNGRCEDESGRLAGSALDMSAAVRGAIVAGIPSGDALAMASRIPGEWIAGSEEPQRGVLLPGTSADLIHLDDSLYVRATWIAGRRLE